MKEIKIKLFFLAMGLALIVAIKFFLDLPSDFQETLISVVGVCTGLVGLSPVAEVFQKNIQTQRARASLKAMSHFADFFPLELRKRIKALAGDYEVEIKRLHKEKRYKTARWNKVLAWGYAIGYVLRGPFDWFAEALIKSWKGL